MKKAKKFIIFAALIVVLALLGCAKKEIKNVDSQGKNIICFGDSFTFGYGADKGNDYPSQLAKIIKRPVINSGVSGDTTEDALARIKQEALDKQPLLVIIEFSGNDFLKKIPMQETEKNIEKMIDLIQKEKSMVALVDISAGMFFRDYRLLLNKIASRKQAIFIPSLLSGVITMPSLKSDFLHPNDKGYYIVAQRIAAAINPYLAQNNNFKQPVNK